MNQKKEPIVSDYMIREVLTLKPDLTMEDAADFFIEHRIAGAPVVNENDQVIGVLSETDCLRILMDENVKGGQPVQNHMTDLVWIVEPGTSILYVSKIMIDAKLRRLPVVEENRLVGQISMSDCIHALRQAR